MHSLCEFHALIRKLLMYIRSPYPKTISEMVFHKQVTLGKQEGFHFFVSFLFLSSKIKKSFYTCHKISNNMLLDAITCLQCLLQKAVFTVILLFFHFRECHLGTYQHFSSIFGCSLSINYLIN